MVKQALQNPGILTCYPLAPGGSQVGDDWAAMQADLDRGAPCRWYGTYYVSKPLEVKSTSTSIEGFDATKTTIIPHSTWNYTNDHQLMRSWTNTDWTGGETNHFLAPINPAAPSIYPKIRNLQFHANDDAGSESHDLTLCHWHSAQERSFIRDCIFHAGITDTGASKNIVGLWISSLNFHTQENLVFYGNGYRNALRAESGGNYHLQNFVGPGSPNYEAQIALNGIVEGHLLDTHMEGAIAAAGTAYVDIENCYGLVLNICQSFSPSGITKPWLRVRKTGGAGPNNVRLKDCHFILSGSYPKFSVPFIQDWQNTIDFQSTTIAGQSVSPVGIGDIQHYDGESIKFVDGAGGAVKSGYFRASPTLPGITDSKLNATYLSCTGLTSQGYTTPDAAKFDLTLGVDLRALVLPDNWAATGGAQPLVTKFGAEGQQSYQMFLGQSTGTIVFYYTVDGSTDRGIISTATVPSTTPSTTSPTWVRVLADATSGTNVSATFYTSTDGVTWTALGTAGTNTPAGPIFSGSSAVTAAQWGDNVGGFVGRFYKAEVRTYLGVLVDSIDLTSATTGATVTGAAGAVWTAGSASTITTTRQVNPSQLVPGADNSFLGVTGGVPTWLSTLHTQHVAAATPTGGTSGDIRVGTGKIWVNDAGTWKSATIA